MDFEGFAGLGFDPFAVDVGDIFLEEGWVFELREYVREWQHGGLEMALLNVVETRASVPKEHLYQTLRRSL